MGVERADGLGSSRRGAVFVDIVICLLLAFGVSALAVDMLSAALKREDTLSVRYESGAALSSLVCMINSGMESVPPDACLWHSVNREELSSPYPFGYAELSVSAIGSGAPFEQSWRVWSIRGR